MARTPHPWHNATMPEDHPRFSAVDHKFTVKIETDPLNAARSRWEIHEGSQIHLRSPHSYATHREAESEAAKALVKFTLDRHVP